MEKGGARLLAGRRGLARRECDVRRNELEWSRGGALVRARHEGGGSIGILMCGVGVQGGLGVG